jgi:hypothetical protein
MRAPMTMDRKSGVSFSSICSIGGFVMSATIKVPIKTSRSWKRLRPADTQMFVGDPGMTTIRCFEFYRESNIL